MVSPNGCGTDGEAMGNGRVGLRGLGSAARRGWRVAVLLGLAGCQPAGTPVPYWQAGRPAYEFGELYARVEGAGLFGDSKDFADAEPRRDPAQILRAYAVEKPATRGQLEAFVRQYFLAPSGLPARPSANLELQRYSAALWPLLARPSLQTPAYGSAIGVPFAYTVPGGRMRELHCADAYFMMLGLLRDGEPVMARDLLDDCAALINRYGHMPAGARTYYLSRSAPPLFYRMIELVYGADPAAGYASYLSELRREYSFWMRGAESVAAGQSFEHVVGLPGGAVLNRYWDALAQPRDEAYREDTALAARSGRPAAALYQELRAAAESGWDASPRWLADPGAPASVQTTSLLPVDLNALLFGLERAIAAGCERRRDQACATAFLARAWHRKQAINTYLWRADQGRYADYNWRQGRASERISAAMFYPLFVGIATPLQAASVARLSERELLGPGGLAASAPLEGTYASATPGWPQLQWIAVQGLNDYGEQTLAREIARRWIHTVRADFAAAGALRARYRVLDSAPAPTDSGRELEPVGATAGVLRALWSAALDHTSESPRTGHHDARPSSGRQVNAAGWFPVR